MLTKEAYEEWLEHPVTKDFFIQALAAKNRLLDTISSGKTIGQSADITHGLTNQIIGQIQGLDQLLNVSFAEGASNIELTQD